MGLRSNVLQKSLESKVPPNAVLYSAPPIPVRIRSFRWNPAESSGVQWNPAEWDWIPVDSTGLLTEIEIELEFGSKYMCTNSCKHKYGI